MRIISFNANGIRAAKKKGFYNWLATQNADLVCIQETKAQSSQLSNPVFNPDKYHCFFNDALKKGYSGVAIYSKYQPDLVNKTTGLSLIDNEGRFIRLDIGNLTVLSVYFPSGTSGDYRQAIKIKFLDFFHLFLDQLTQNNRDIIICGDFNIAHKKIDLKNWRNNQKNPGFLPEERAWMDQLLIDGKWLDAFREICHEPEQYTWWSYRGQARNNNVGWRIDYQIASAYFKNKIHSASIYKKEIFSDHAPLIIDYDYDLGQQAIAP